MINPVDRTITGDRRLDQTGNRIYSEPGDHPPAFCKTAMYCSHKLIELICSDKAPLAASEQWGKLLFRNAAPSLRSTTTARWSVSAQEGQITLGILSDPQNLDSRKPQINRRGRCTSAHSYRVNSPFDHVATNLRRGYYCDDKSPGNPLRRVSDLADHLDILHLTTGS